MRWSSRQKVERPEYPKLVPIAGTVKEASGLLASIMKHDSEAAILDGGERGTYLKVHNSEAEAAAKSVTRTFPLD
jgi:hypothetical protein